MALTKKINFKTGLNMKEFVFLVFLICSAGSSTILQLLSLFIFSIGFLFVGTKIRFTHRWFFYIGLLLLSLIQLLFVWKSDYGINYIVNTIFITLMWFLGLQCSNIVTKNVAEIPTPNIEKIINIFFKLNCYIVVLQFIWMCIDMQTLFPFSNMSAGDNVKGFFRNSSVNMIIMSFYTVYYFYKKNFKKSLIAATIMLTTFYMSGLVLFIFTAFIVLFLKFNLKNKLKIVVGLFVMLFLFVQFSPENAKYVDRILNKKIKSKTDPPRKLVSLEQTLDSWTQDPEHFIFGSGGGKFSSRTAFITAGEYVGWFPQSLVYISEDFKENHFPLWNKKILSIPYKDGTSNQPFSFYNKILGEYGFLGLILFVVYLITPIKHYKKLSYGRLLFILIFPFFLLDYWFEYFSVIIFFELFLYLNIKSKTYIIDETPK
jgi:hypothetical protein